MSGLDDLPRIDPRDVLIEKATGELHDAVYRVRRDNGLTHVEMLGLLIDAIDDIQSRLRWAERIGRR